jgi:hypothetical protein
VALQASQSCRSAATLKQWKAKVKQGGSIIGWQRHQLNWSEDYRHILYFGQLAISDSTWEWTRQATGPQTDRFQTGSWPHSRSFSLFSPAFPPQHADHPRTGAISSMGVSNTAETTSLCVVCGKEAKLWCQACKFNINDEETRTWYCSKECQTQHWVQHKAHCLEITSDIQVHRGARLAQAAFYIFRKHAFDVIVAHIREDKNLLVLRQQNPNVVNDMFIPFPQHLVPNKEAEEMLLTYCACEESVAILHNLLRMAFNGTYADF